MCSVVYSELLSEQRIQTPSPLWFYPEVILGFKSSTHIQWPFQLCISVEVSERPYAMFQCVIEVSILKACFTLTLPWQLLNLLTHSHASHQSLRSLVLWPPPRHPTFSTMISAHLLFIFPSTPAFSRTVPHPSPPLSAVANLINENIHTLKIFS